LNARRPELLAAALTIWRWGRQQTDLKQGLPIASFETWGKWCRDPLIALGCADPVERVRQAKQADPRRRQMAELFEIWQHHHGCSAVTVAGLAPEVADVLDPQQRGRQHRAARLQSMTGMRIAGCVLEREAAAGKWGASTYAVRKITVGQTIPAPPNPPAPKPPMVPMPMSTEGRARWQAEL
jgi:hypothetical protein